MGDWLDSSLAGLDFLSALSFICTALLLFVLFEADCLTAVLDFAKLCFGFPALMDFFEDLAFLLAVPFEPLTGLLVVFFLPLTIGFTLLKVFALVFADLSPLFTDLVLLAGLDLLTGLVALDLVEILALLAALDLAF